MTGEPPRYASRTLPAIYPLTIVATEPPGNAGSEPYVALREYPDRVAELLADPDELAAYPRAIGRGWSPAEAWYDLINRLQHARFPRYRVLCSGSREWIDARTVFADLDALLSRHPEGLIVVHGSARRGADRVVHMWCRQHRENVLEEPHPVTPDEWDALGNKAGPLRNQRMVDLGADMMLAWVRGASPGTRGCIRMAKDASIPMRVRQAGMG